VTRIKNNEVEVFTLKGETGKRRVPGGIHIQYFVVLRERG
jgi:hypothetical protein